MTLGGKGIIKGEVIDRKIPTDTVRRTLKVLDGKASENTSPSLPRRIHSTGDHAACSQVEVKAFQVPEGSLQSLSGFQCDTAHMT